MYLSFTEGERVTRTRMYYVPFIYLSYTEIERVTRRRMYYLPFIYWGREGDKKKNVLCTFHLLRVRGWQEQECSIYLSYTEIERVTRRRMYYLPFIYWGREGDKKKNVLCTFHLLRERGWQEEECSMYLSYTEIERVTRRRMYYLPFIYWGREGECIMYLSFTEGERQEQECIMYLSYTERGWQEEECIMYLSFTEGERVTRRRM